MNIRTLRNGEEWPDSLAMGFSGPTLDRAWCWVAEKDGAVIAGLLACPMHGAIFLMRLAAAKEAPPMTTLVLLRSALRMAKARGCVGFTTLLDTTTTEGAKMASLVKHCGGMSWPEPVTLQFGLMERV